MNIHDFHHDTQEKVDRFPEALRKTHIRASLEWLLSPEIWDPILALRRETFMGFLKIEESHGVTHNPRPLAIFTRKGQEEVRGLLFRSLEEFWESADSNTPEHEKEELIDAINYLMATCFYLPENYPKELLKVLPGKRPLVTLPALPSVLDILMRTLEVSFRARPWQETLQSEFKTHEYYGMLLAFLGYIVSRFTQREFLEYFIAKNAVLEFRIRSHY